MKKLLIILSIFAFACSKKPDPTPPQHIKAYYRLKHVDKDGTITYSKIVTVIEPVK